MTGLIGTGSPSYGLHVFNDAGCAIEASTTANIILKLEGKKDGGGANIDESTLQFSYTDADYLSGAEQTGASVILGKQSDASQWTTLKTTMNEATDADVFVAEKNAGFSNNTTESQTQNYVWTATGADLTIDRSYYNVVVTGAGAIGDEINLPEVASNSDNWDSSLTDVQVQVGQEYTITARRNASTGLVLRPFTGDLINGQTSITLPYSANGTSVILKCNEFTAGVGYWYTY